MTVLASPPTPATTFRVTTPTRSNAKTWARKFEARLLEPGIVSYDDVGCGKAFLTKEDIAASIETFIGRPLILTPKLRHKRVSPADLEKDARGYITEVFFNPEDGWFWCRGICSDDDAKDAIDRVGFCSCAYEVEKVGPGGEYHAIPYNERIVKFSGEHLAIVDRPRYEGATIRLNSKQTTTTMFKWIKKIASRSNSAEAPAAPAAAPAAPAAPTNAPALEATPTKENAKLEEISAETEFEIPSRENGKTEKVTLGTLITSHRDRENGLNPEDHLEVDGKQVTVADLVAGYKANAVKANAEAPKGDDEEKKKKTKENAAPAAPAAAPAPSHFKVLMNARDNGVAAEGPKVEPDDMLSRCNRGASRYGTSAGKN